jgi:hypothetical protein
MLTFYGGGGGGCPSCIHLVLGLTAELQEE